MVVAWINIGRLRIGDIMRSVFRPALLLVDLGLIAIATLFAALLRDNLEIVPERTEALLPYLALTLASAAVVLPASGLSRSIWRFSVMSDYLRVLAAVVIIVLSAVAAAFLVNRLDGVARALPVTQALIMGFLLIGVRAAMRMRHVSRKSAPSCPIETGPQETVLVVGINVLTDLFLRSVAEFAPERMRVAGIVGRNARHSGRLLQQHPILGLPEEIQGIVKTLEVHGISVNRIVVTTGFTALSPEAQRALLEIERSSDIRLDFFAERIGLAEPANSPSELAEEIPAAPPSTAPPDDGAPVPLSAAALGPTMQRPYWRLKRFFDTGAAALLIVLLAPLISLLTLMVAFDIGFPTVFWQQRPGARGVPFKLYKFRTMRNAHDASGTRIPDAQRVSSTGRFLRRTRLDELPQLYNILVGEMSFVGPRPLLPVDGASLMPARLLAPPGLTGWAQIKGGRLVSPQDKVALDVWYLRHASLWLDIGILAQTLPMMIFGERAEPEAVRRARAELAESATMMA
jgi:lipopolysaccharide/colanic/teichoic acid biosynthesis glycosyltransferase